MGRCPARPTRFLMRVLGPLILLTAVHGATADETGAERMQELEKRVEALEAELAPLKAELAEIRQKSTPTSQPNILAAEQSSTLQTSGFLHVFGDPLHLDVCPFTLGSFEYDVTASLSETVSTSGALVFTQDQIALGVGFVDVHLGEKGVGPRRRIFGEPGFHLQVGRFERVVRCIADGNLDVRTSLRQADELQDFAAALGHTTESLTTRIRRLREIHRQMHMLAGEIGTSAERAPALDALQEQITEAERMLSQFTIPPLPGDLVQQPTHREEGQR